MNNDEHSQLTIDFPWGIIALVTGTVLFLTIAFKDFQQYLNKNENMSTFGDEIKSNSFVAEVVLCIFVILLQIIANSSNSLFVAEDKISGEVQKIGVWYISTCLFSTDCKTLTRYQRVQELIQKYEGYTGGTSFIVLFY